MLRSNRLLFLLLTLWLLLINGSSAAGRSKLGASDPGSSDEPAASKSSTDTPHPSIVVTSGPDSKDDSLVVWSEPVLSNKPPGAAPAPNTSTAPSPGPEQESKTIAQVIDKALEKEFEKDTKAAEEDKGKTYNATVANEEVCAAGATDRANQTFQQRLLQQLPCIKPHCCSVVDQVQA